jgi:hypothetical protein
MADGATVQGSEISADHQSIVREHINGVGVGAEAEAGT